MPNALAVTYKHTGRFADAEALYLRALPILESSLGPAHPDVGGLGHNLAGLAHSRGRYTDAEPLARRSIEIREAALGPDHPTSLPP